MFHSSLLWIHILNDDHLFLGHLEMQVANFSKPKPEWAVDKVLAHYGTGKDALFEMRWTTGDITWLSYNQIVHLDALDEYLKLQDVEGIRTPPHDNPQMPLCPPVTVLLPNPLMRTEATKSGCLQRSTPTTCPKPDQTILFGDEHKVVEQIIARWKKCDAVSGCLTFPNQGLVSIPSAQGSGNQAKGQKCKGKEQQKLVEEVGKGSAVRGARLEMDAADAEFNENMDQDSRHLWQWQELSSAHRWGQDTIARGCRINELTRWKGM
ncbi:hypothetical protein PAXRUDRAFT_797952 [Paxillus rubicundulus Ve08.2h10]|uniref:Unplaced genomic scaffold scaffold_574, whole genome shotgun sequence n=1 Tax=Paxillus rubicundulus Ve08.2h10 TaxID=930991 RepID=A0A0D0E344_9AGAM|nr:hypothetical protein PAXRUDRAFT_797952 [Paxillus rubicundulus Ve08.2h10]